MGLYSQLLAAQIIMWGPGLTTENIMLDNINDTGASEGQCDNVNQMREQCWGH